MSASPDECARDLLDVAPMVMRIIRANMRDHAATDLSVPQFRALGFVDRHAGASLSDVAEHLGLQLPSVSRLVDGLVARTLMTRQEQATDRRYVTLRVTPRGRARLQTAYDSARAYLTDQLAVLPEAKLKIVIDALCILRPLFTGERETTLAGRPHGNFGD
jgi:DNA-binding MarR family transcriptional regulator